MALEGGGAVVFVEDVVVERGVADGGELPEGGGGDGVRWWWRVSSQYEGVQGNRRRVGVGC